MGLLDNRKVALLATDGFEEVELTEPRKAVETEGATVHIISLKNGTIRSWKDGNWGQEVEVDKSIEEVSASDYNSLLLPGGVINPDLLRRNGKAVKFVRDFFDQHKPVAAICHAPWMLAEAGVLKGRKVTSFASIKTDIQNAGANWVDEEVVVDEGLVTSRSPEDLPAFNAKVLEEFCEGKHEEQTV